jgi:hypothetical protein
MDEDLIDDSNLRRLIETAYLGKRGDGCYTAISPIGVIDSKVWYSIAYNHLELCSGEITLDHLEKYLVIREFPDSKGVPIVDDNRIYTTNRAAAVPVRSRRKSEWRKNIYHYVSITNLPKKDDAETQKNNLLRYLTVICFHGGQPIAHIMPPRNCTILADGRIPYTSSIVDLHGSVALLHLSLTRGFEDFELWGFNTDTIRVTQYMVRRQLKVGRKIDNDILNDHILHRTNLFDSLRKRHFSRRD